MGLKAVREAASSPEHLSETRTLGELDAASLTALKSCRDEEFHPSPGAGICIVADLPLGISSLIGRETDSYT